VANNMDRGSLYAEIARRRIEELNQRIGPEKQP
jgi:hypothetical protein